MKTFRDMLGEAVKAKRGPKGKGDGMKPFKVGDKVKVARKASSYPGATGTVKAVNGGQYMVKLDNDKKNTANYSFTDLLPA